MIVFRMLCRSKTLIITALLFLLLTSSTFASELDDERAKLKNIGAQIEATKAKQDDATKRLENILLQIQQSDQRIVQVQTELNNLRMRRNDTIAGRQYVKAKLDEAQKRLDEMQAELDAARKNLALKQKVFNKRMVSIYKNDKPSVVVALLGSESFGDLFKRVALIDMIANEDSRLVLRMKRLTATITSNIAEIEATKKIIDQQYVRLVAEENRINAINNNIIAQLKQLQYEANKQQQLLAQVQQEKRRLAQTEGQLKASSNKVVEQIKTLERQRALELSRRNSSMKAAGGTIDSRIITEIARKYGIPIKLFSALVRQESGWNHKAVSSAGAIGLTQVMPFNITAMGYDIRSFKNSPKEQLEAGAAYLSEQYKTFGRWDLALAAYNAGPGAVRMYGGIPPYAETRNYVRSILRMAGPL